MTATAVATRARSRHVDAEALSQLRTVLVAARTAEEAAVEGHTSTVTELTGQGDVDSLLERELAAASAVRATEELVEIDAALARVDAGTYGYCEACGQPIVRERLEAIPQSRLCVACSASSRAFGPLGSSAGAGPSD